MKLDAVFEIPFIAMCFITMILFFRYRQENKLGECEQAGLVKYAVWFKFMKKKQQKKTVRYGAFLIGLPLNCLILH